MCVCVVCVCVCVRVCVCVVWSGVVWSGVVWCVRVFRGDGEKREREEGVGGAVYMLLPEAPGTSG